MDKEESFYDLMMKEPVCIHGEIALGCGECDLHSEEYTKEAPNSNI
tara:strand:- start:781 stop:918 length:138 start_codon:yes stop_codon:yes gene_type:complete